MPENSSDLTFEQIEIGLCKEFHVDITQSMVDDFAKISGDFNPIHMNEEFAKSTKFGGKIGWTSQTQISKNILDEIIKLKTGEISDPIQINNAYLIIKVNEKRTIESKIDIEKEMKKLVIIEKDKQLNQYSIMYFNRIKNNLFINDL